MAWYKKYGIPFQSFGGTQYMVYICEQTSGSLVMLTGADEPFVTSEDNTDDIFTPIRRQTGYLRIIDETVDGSLLETLIPANNTEKLVQLYTGTWNSSYTTFTEWSVKWQGFLCAEAYTQPWERNKKVIEFPVKSMLAALEDVQMSEANAGSQLRVARLIVQAFTTLGITPSDVYVSSQMYFEQNDFMKVILQYAIFYGEETINNQGDSYKQMVGKSYYEALSDVCSLYGLTMREYGTTISFASYDKQGARIYTDMWEWRDIEDFANNVYVVGGDGGFLPETSLLNALTFKGTNNVAGFLPGGRSAVVELGFSPLNEEIISLPMTTEDASTVYTVDKVANGEVRVQPHSPRAYSSENFYFYAYTNSQAVASSSTYSACLNKSVIFVPIMPAVTDDPSFETGAFPVRYSYMSPDETGTKIMTNGLMVGIRSMLNYSDGLPTNAQKIYDISSSLSYTHSIGYLNIEMAISCFMETNAGHDRKLLQFGTTGYSYQRRYKMFLQLRWGSYYWDGEEWTNDNTVTFAIETDGAKILTNKTDDIFSDKDDGFFVPVTRSMSGQITLTIMNFAVFEITYPNNQAEVFRVNSSIISSLGVSYLTQVGDTVSDRTQNTYRETILQSGFSEDKKITLTIGTINNNVESFSFIKDGINSYKESVSYYTNNSTTDMRPEMHLLGRMVSQYGQVRRTFTGIVESGIDILNTRYIYLSRAFFGVDAQHNWRDDTQQIKFIEVS